MTEFSANLGFLWTDRSLPDAIFAAKAAGFHAVECHWPYDVPAKQVKAALDATGLKMLSLNTRPGDLSTGDFGLSALVGRESEAMNAITEAMNYAVAINAAAIHVIAGNAEGPKAHKTFVQNLSDACALAKPYGVTILIEPLNRFDAPEYFLRNAAQARGIIEEVDQPNLKLMFDCYHAARTESDVVGSFQMLLPIIGHVQFASVPDRDAPDCGTVDYKHVFAEIERCGWDRPLGAEYRPRQDTAKTLSWLNDFTR